MIAFRPDLPSISSAFVMYRSRRSLFSSALVASRSNRACAATQRVQKAGMLALVRSYLLDTCYRQQVMPTETVTQRLVSKANTCRRAAIARHRQSQAPCLCHRLLKLCRLGVLLLLYLLARREHGGTTGGCSLHVAHHWLIASRRTEQPTVLTTEPYAGIRPPC